MKGDRSAIATLLLVAGLSLAAAGADVVLWVVRLLAGWLRALPPPTEHAAGLLGDYAWPMAIVLIAWWLRAPIEQAAHKLAHRMERDDIQFGNLLKVTSRDVTTYSALAVSEEPNAPEVADVKHGEAILEYASESAEKAKSVVDWIFENVGSTTDIEAFFNDAIFAGARKGAYDALVKGI